MNCYCCREYGECTERHQASDLVWARHKDGQFWWGGLKKRGRGLWVKICKACRDYMLQE